MIKGILSLTLKTEKRRKSNMFNIHRKKILWFFEMNTVFLFIYYQFDIFIKENMYWISFMWPQLNSWSFVWLLFFLYPLEYTIKVFMQMIISLLKKSISFFESYIYFIVSISLVHVHTSKVEFKVRFIYFIIVIEFHIMISDE